MCSSNLNKNFCGTRILIKGPKIFQKIFKNGKNFEFFHFSSQDLQILGLHRFWDHDFISVGIFLVWSPPFLPHGPPKFKKVKFSFSTQSLQNWFVNQLQGSDFISVEIFLIGSVVFFPTPQKSTAGTVQCFSSSYKQGIVFA